MTRQSTDTCASCMSYPLDEAAGNKGWAMCKDFEQPREFNDRCVLHMPASVRERERRRALVIKIMEERK